MDRNIDEILKKIGENIQLYRIKCGMSIEELSSETGIKTRYLTKIERGSAKRLAAKHILVFAKTFKIELYKLFAGL